MKSVPVLVSGIQPTGKLHLGNYLGALKNFVILQNTEMYDCLFFVADLHSLTEQYTPKQKTEQIFDLFVSYLAVGLDPKKSTLFQQSAISEHSELSWILNTITPFGELRRMTQFKDKSENESENTNVGLFNYPVLMAADILLYGASVVPVGDDQLQHLELTREIARKFNSKFGATLIEPKPLLTSVSRLMSLDDPEKKMSKSRPEGCLFLDDEPSVIRKKIQRAVTDSEPTIAFDMENRPGISNLVGIYSSITAKTPEQIVSEYKGKGYAEFKKDLAEKIIETLFPIQEKKRDLLKNPKNIKEILIEGNKKAKEHAEKRYKEIKEKIGIL